MLNYMDERWWIAAIQPRRSDEEKKKSPKRIWALPKGMIDPGEKPAETAVREVREETGVEAALIAKLQDIKYMYVRTWGDNEKIFKVVSFYLLRYRSGTLGNIPPEMEIEVEHVEWVPLDEAERRLSYGGERQVAKLARQYVATHDLALTAAEKRSTEN